LLPTGTRLPPELYSFPQLAHRLKLMTHVWANPETQWGGFHRYRRYWLNDKRVLILPLKRRVDGKEVPASVGEIYKSLEGRHFESGEATGATEILAELGVNGISFGHEVLEAMLTLRNDGVPPFSTQLFLYDHSSGSDSPSEFYTFFVVCDGKIVSEEVRFHDSPESGFDPFVFESGDDSFWSRIAKCIGSERGIAQFWYRKFYNETFVGQMVLLGSPLLRWKFDGTAKTHALLWVLIILTSLILIRLGR
jgi:hypothetical protein